MIVRIKNRMLVGQNVYFDASFFYLVDGVEVQDELSLGGIIFNINVTNQEIENFIRASWSNWFDDKDINQIIIE
jgi:hypothetical protein